MLEAFFSKHKPGPFLWPKFDTVVNLVLLLLLLSGWFQGGFVRFQSELRATEAEREAAKLQKEVDRLEGKTWNFLQQMKNMAARNTISPTLVTALLSQA